MRSTPVRSFLANRLAGSPLVPGRLRIAIYNFCGMDVRTTAITHSLTFAGANLTIQPGCFINVGCHFDCPTERISIGSNVAIGPRVMFLTTTHQVGGPDKRAGVSVSKPVVVESGCWIGAGSVILPGVTIGRGCLIAAGAVVGTDCEPNGMYAGVPAVRKRELSNPAD